ncbi:MAG: radical SAM protein [Deltaproteobacteria bacterium]|nr:radical SAM protein [Deltaproteobacteria bacterium]
MVDEMEEMTRTHGLDYFFFVDDIFNHPAKQAEDICRELIRRKLNVGWTCFATPKSMTIELLRLMKEAGCKGVEFGTDAASDLMLRNMGKSFTKADVRRVSALCKEAGLPAAHYIILGGPGETEETVKEAFEFMDEVDPRAVIAMIGVRVYPKTPLEQTSIDDGIIKAGQSILDSTFYISPLIDRERLLSIVETGASERRNWVVPALDIRNSEEAMAALRRFGHRGPLWDMLGERRRTGIKEGANGTA